MIEHLVERLDFLIVGIVGIAAFIGLVYFRNWTLGIKFSEDILPYLYKDPGALSAYFRNYNWMLVVLIVGLALVGVLN